MQDHILMSDVRRAYNLASTKNQIAHKLYRIGCARRVDEGEFNPNLKPGEIPTTVHNWVIIGFERNRPFGFTIDDYQYAVLPPTSTHGTSVADAQHETKFVLYCTKAKGATQDSYSEQNQLLLESLWNHVMYGTELKPLKPLSDVEMLQMDVLLLQQEMATLREELKGC